MFLGNEFLFYTKNARSLVAIATIGEYEMQYSTKRHGQNVKKFILQCIKVLLIILFG